MFRKMRRFKQQLTQRECEEILISQKRGVLAVLGDDGYPYAVPLDYVFDGGCLYFHSAVEGHKIDSIRACDKGSFNVIVQRELCDDGWSYFFDSVTVFGRLSEVNDAELKAEKLRLLGNKYFPDTEITEKEIEKNGPRCALIELRTEHMTGKRVHER